MAEGVKRKRGRPEMAGLYADAYSCQSWLNFVRSIHSKATLKGYCHDIKHYMDFLNVRDPDKLLEGNQVLLENQILGYIDKRKGEGAGSDSIRRACASIKKFYDRNRVALAWPFILGTIGKTKRRKKDKAYTKEQLQKLLSIADIREKCLILFYCSSGFRKGGIPELQIRNLHPIEKYGIYRVSVYEGYEEEYQTFCTPECRKALDEYFEFRRSCGEPIGPDSPVIRESFNIDDPDKVKAPSPIKESTIYGQLNRLAQEAGLRKRVKMTEGVKYGTIRHDFKLVHGMRKFFDTQATLAGVSPLWVEILEGHDIKLKESYLRPSADDLLEGSPPNMRGYVDAIDYLTIDESQMLRRKVKMMEVEVDKYKKLEHTQDLMMEYIRAENEEKKALIWKKMQEQKRANA